MVVSKVRVPAVVDMVDGVEVEGRERRKLGIRGLFEIRKQW